MSNTSRMYIFALILLLVASMHSTLLLGQPSGATISNNVTETAPVTAAGSLATAGGSFTTLILNATSQNVRWKAYVGNITGELTLQDSTSQTIYDWQLSIITGEVYSSRNNSVNWGTIVCANRTNIEAEDVVLNMTAGSVDTINNTFNNTVHSQFFVGANVIANSTCPAIATYVNDTKQAVDENADFQEILLQSGTTIIYSTILENNAPAYHENKTFDFQMIVAEDQFASSPTPYYFYAELG